MKQEPHVVALSHVCLHSKSRIRGKNESMDSCYSKLSMVDRCLTQACQGMMGGVRLIRDAVIIPGLKNESIQDKASNFPTGLQSITVLDPSKGVQTKKKK